MANGQDVRQLVHTPAEMMSDYVRWAERAKDDPGIPWGLPAIDKRVIPMRPGELIAIMGRPGHGKTSLLAYLARQEANRIIKRGAAATEAVVYVSWEQASEEISAMLLADAYGFSYSVSDVAWGRVDLDTIRRQAVKGGGHPIWIVGHGIGRVGKNPPRMTPEVVLAAIESMQEDFGVKPTLMLFDYLQIIPIKSASERVQQVTEAPIRIKEVALRLGAPAVCGVQASRDADKRNDHIPEMFDAQWASSIEQTCDKVFGLWRPARDHEIGHRFKAESGKEYTVSEALMFVRMLKQRGDQGRHTWALYFDPSRLKLAEMETSANDRDF